MPSTHFRKLSTVSIQATLTVALFIFPVMRLQAQSGAGIGSPGVSQVACSIESPSGLQECEQPPAASSCDAEANFASQPSEDTVLMVFVNQGDKPVKVYWLNFRGQ